MFGFGRKRGYDEDFDFEAVTSRYEGDTLVSDYIPDNLNREEVNQLDNPYHLMVPHGHGKLMYLLHGEVIEEYEGEFDGGLYHGKGRLIWRGEVFEGSFENGEFKG